MKIKTIKKILAEVIEEWTDSITDAGLAKRVKDEAIVTGGCIASMLLKEKVNDYDIYLQNKQTVKDLANYYTKNTGIVVIDGAEFDGFVYDDDFEGYSGEFDIKGHQHARCVDGISSDRIKLFIKDKGIHTIQRENVDEKKFLPVAFSANAITLTDQVQVVLRFHGDAETIHENYDFVHATNYYTGGELFLRKEALECLLTKELRYIGSKYPITSIIRTKKFIKRGYTITAGEYLKICWQVSELNLKDVSVLEEQLAGVDVAYFDQLIKAMKSIDDPAKMTYPYISKIIDKIFN